MRDELEPIVGKWYHDVELDEPFRVAAIDEEREVIEVRYLDGETDEIALEDWSSSISSLPRRRRRRPRRKTTTSATAPGASLMPARPTTGKTTKTRKTTRTTGTRTNRNQPTSKAPNIL